MIRRTRNFIADSFTVEKLGDKYMISFYFNTGDGELHKLYEVLMSIEEMKKLKKNLEKEL